MLQKLSNSWGLIKASGRVLRADKELIVFPLISSIALIMVTATFFLPLLFSGTGFEVSEGTGPLGYILLFLYYMVQYTVIFFFNSALVGAAMIRLDGGNPTVGDGLRIASSRIGPILGYAAIAATVGLVLRAMSERSGGLGRMIVGLLGMAWNLATFLVVPVLVTHNVSPLDAIKESARVLKKTWGEQVAGNVGIGAAFFVAYLALAVIAVPAMILAFSTGQGSIIAVVAVCIVLAFILLALVNASLAGIYSAALYRFATTGEAGAFDNQVLRNAFVAKAR